MTGRRLDPDNLTEVVFSTRLAQPDAERVIELSRQAGVGKSEFIRSAVLSALERDTGPPEDD